MERLNKGFDSKKRKKNALGKGLSALIPDIESIEEKESKKDFFYCDIDLISPNPYQPRVNFSKEELDDLCRSIKDRGILQPVILRKADSGYELIAGERRFRAARMAELRQVPALLKNVTDKELIEISIIENIQREDLNPMEEAEAYHNLIKLFNLTQEKASERLGKSRSAIANFLRLRNLPDSIKKDIRDGRLSMGHARALLGADTAALQIRAWQTVVSKNLSVRETEALVKRLKTELSLPPKKELSSEDAYFSTIADEISRQIGTKVKIKRKSGQKGKIEIDFYTDNDLEHLINLLKQSIKD